MKYIIITTLFTILMYGKGIGTHEYAVKNKTQWCVNVNDVEKWNMIDNKGKSYVFSQEEMDNLSKEEFEWITINIRVKAVLFKHVE